MQVMKQKTKVKFKSLAAEQIIYIVGMGDYFEEDGPNIRESKTKQELADELEQDGVTFDDFKASSGDGQENFVVMTILNNTLCIVD